MDEPKPKPAKRPTPVRAAMEGVRPDESSPAPEPEERRLEVEGGEVIVRVQGRGMTRLAPGYAPLLLLGFFTSDEATAPERESLVAIPSLQAADEGALRAAWEDGVAPRGEGERADIFADSVGDRRRGR